MAPKLTRRYVTSDTGCTFLRAMLHILEIFLEIHIQMKLNFSNNVYFRSSSGSFVLNVQKRV